MPAAFTRKSSGNTVVIADVNDLQIAHEGWTSARNSSDVTSIIVAAVDVTSLVFAIPASEVWVFDFVLRNGCSGVGGVKYAITIPSGATLRAHAVGMAASATAITSALMTASGTLTIAFNAAALTTGWTRISGTVVNSTTAGNVQLQFASNTNAQTSTVYANSSVRAQKLG